MEDISELEKKGLTEALNIKNEDLHEAKYNLLGFFGALCRIDKRIKNDKNIQKNGDKK